MGCKYSKDFLKKYSKKKKMEDGGLAGEGASAMEEEWKEILKSKTKIGDSKDPRKESGSDEAIHKRIEKLRKQAYSDNPSPDLKDHVEDQIVKLRNKLGK